MDPIQEPPRSSPPPGLAGTTAGARRLAHRRGAYGFDAPAVPVVLGALGVAFLIASGASAVLGRSPLAAAVFAVYGLFALLSAASYIYTTRRGKFRVWAGLLLDLGLHGDERVADLGCGRGAVLLMAAQLLPGGTAVGVDLWKTRDQSGNDPAATRRNAEREGVAERVELRTADLRTLPLADDAFDLVLSSLAIHNISGMAERLRAIDEAARILRPGGRLLIADIRATAQYAGRLRERGLGDVQLRALGWRFWYGGPWVETRLVSARKPLEQAT
jgi:SAM-dependent methyltransferase